MKEVITQELRAYQEKKLETFKKQNEKSSFEAIVFVGDSLIEFFPIKKYIKTSNPLYNRGISGIDTIWLVQHLKEQALALYPSYIFLLIGTNDLGLGREEGEIYQHIVTLIAQIKESNLETTICLLSILPVNSSNQYAKTVKLRSNSQISSLNERLASLSGIEYIDVYTDMLDEQGQLHADYTTDGLHLTPKGYQKLSEKLLLYI